MVSLLGAGRGRPSRGPVGHTSCKRQASGSNPLTGSQVSNGLYLAAALAAVGVELPDDAYLFSNGPAHARPWNPDWATHKVADAAAAAGVELDIKGGRHYTASQLLVGGFDLRNTAARLSHSRGAARPRCGTTRTRSPEWTGEPPHTSHS